MYQAQCCFESDRIDDNFDSVLRKSVTGKKPDDLFGVLEHSSGVDDWAVVLNPDKKSNFARYAAGVNPNNLDEANCFAYTVPVGGFYHIMIVFDRDCKAGDPVQYYYRGLDDEKNFSKVPWQAPPI